MTETDPHQPTSNETTPAATGAVVEVTYVSEVSPKLTRTIRITGTAAEVIQAEQTYLVNAFIPFV